ncbi:unnamed protein product [Choristocarpus tenellus]
MFLAGMIRADLANSVRELEPRAVSLCMWHWHRLQHVLRYVAGTLDICIHYGWGGKDINAADGELLVDHGDHGDSNWGTDSLTCRSVTGYLLLFNGSPIAWCSKLQGAVTLSSSVAEWTGNGIWHAPLLFPSRHSGGDRHTTGSDVLSWFCYNRGAIQAGSITCFNGRTKHVNMKLKCTREYVDQGLLHVEYVPTSKQLADILTESLRKSLTSDFVHSVLSCRE